MSNCHFCGSKLVWQCDYDYEDYGIVTGNGIVAVLMCSNPDCNALAEFYLDIPNEDTNEI